MVVCADPFCQVTTEQAPGLVCECLHPSCAQLSLSLSHIGVDGMCWALGTSMPIKGDLKGGVAYPGLWGQREWSLNVLFLISYKYNLILGT